MKKSLLVFTFISIMFSIGCKSTENLEYSTSPKEIGKLIINDLLTRPEFMMYQVEDVKALHYAEACAAYGAIKLASFLNEESKVKSLKERYDRVMDDSIPNTANHVDANVFGILPLELFIQTKNETYLNQGIEFADGQWKDPLPNGLTGQTRYWIDDVYMIGVLQTQAFRATGKKIYLERAALQIDSYIKELQQPNGLFHHSSEAPFFWGRGNGWVAAGLAELLIDLPDSNVHYVFIRDAYRKMMKTLLDFQAEDGMWHQLIDHDESFKETSSTAMFGYAITVGVKKGLLEEKAYQVASIKAWNALSEYINENGKITEVCVGTGQSKDTSYYLNRPRVAGDLHGQAPMLWLAYSILTDY